MSVANNVVYHRVCMGKFNGRGFDGWYLACERELSYLISTILADLVDARNSRERFANGDCRDAETSDRRSYICP